MKWTKAREKQGDEYVPIDSAITSGPFTICKCLVRDAERFVLYHDKEIVRAYDKAEEAKEAAETLYAAGAR